MTSVPSAFIGQSTYRGFDNLSPSGGGLRHRHHGGNIGAIFDNVLYRRRMGGRLGGRISSAYLQHRKGGARKRTMYRLGNPIHIPPFPPRRHRKPSTHRRFYA